ncbi:hypothetical protein ASD88_24145 [Pelomonas sp. Root662]|nr:hypothetical protein ASC81_22560 [Pelomonas sp. Root405]KRA67689.1 hypothetical protein ASD88_24145 [Pelomonas sp. Root662]
MLMPYAYQALDTQGRLQKGELDASTEDEATEALARQGLSPIELKPLRKRRTAQGRKGRREKPRVAAMLLVRELASLLQAGVTLEESLRTLLDGRRDVPQGEPLTAVLSAVLSGERFSAALQQQAGSPALPLPPYVLALVAAGESTGDLPAALTRAAEQLDFDEQIRAETSEALVYPSILIGAGVSAVLFVFSFVVPRFSSLLAGKNVELPWLSAAVLTVGTFFNEHVVAVMLGMAATVAIGIAVRRALGPQRIRSMLSQWPLLGPWLHQQELSRWTGMLALMLQSRVPILTALDLTAAAVSLPDIQHGLRECVADIGRGEPLSRSLQERQLLPATALSMVRVGERTGQLGQMMGHVAAYSLEANRSTRRRLVALIEPAAILVLGGIIALVVVGVVLALTSLSEVKF